MTAKKQWTTQIINGNYDDIYSYNGEIWYYKGTKTPSIIGNNFVNIKPCPRCHKMQDERGHDACLGKLEDVKAACCGHGIEEGYIWYKDGRVVETPILKPLEII